MSVTWSPDGTELFYRLENRMMVVPFSAEGGAVRTGRPTELLRGEYVVANPGNARQYHVAPDGRFLMLKEVTSEGPLGESGPQVVLVQNFFEELKRLVPN